MAPLHLMEYPTDAHLYSFKWKKFHFSIAKAVLPTTLLSLNRTIPSSCKVQKSNYVWPHILMLPFFIYFTSYVIVHNFCNLFHSLLHKPSSSPFVMLFRRYHWCIYAHCSCILANRKNFSISLERGLCYPFVLFSRHFWCNGPHSFGGL